MGEDELEDVLGVCDVGVCAVGESEEAEGGEEG